MLSRAGLKVLLAVPLLREDRVLGAGCENPGFPQVQSVHCIEDLARRINKALTELPPTSVDGFSEFDVSRASDA